MSANQRKTAAERAKAWGRNMADVAANAGRPLPGGAPAALSEAVARATALSREGRATEASALIREATGVAGAGILSKPSAASATVSGAPEHGDPANGGDPAGHKASFAEFLRRSGVPGAGGPPSFPGASRAPGAPGLRNAGVRARAKRGGAAPDIPAGARWEWREHAGRHGSRRYRLYVPANAPAGAMPLVVMLHGCTQDADDFATGTRILEAAEARGLAVALPEQPRAANPMACWNWFEPAHQDTGGEPGIIAAITGEVAAAERIDRARMVVAGLSAGGAMAAVLGHAYPEVFSGIGVHSGLPHGAARDTASAMAAMRSGPARSGSRPNALAGEAPRLFVMHGEADATVSPANADALLAPYAAEGTARTRAQGQATATRIERGGKPLAEAWRVRGLGHAWSGGAPGASYTAPAMPDATGAMLDFLLGD